MAVPRPQDQPEGDDPMDEQEDMLDAEEAEEEIVPEDEDHPMDSDPEDELAFEEQFILRMPPGEDCEKLKKMIANRDITGDVWFKFKGILV